MNAGNNRCCCCSPPSNQRPAAVAHYKAYKEMLADEMGISPSPDTTALYEQILVDGGAGRRSFPFDPGTSVPVSQLATPVQPVLPVELTTMIGREQEMSEILELLDERRLPVADLDWSGRRRQDAACIGRCRAA